MIEKLLDPIFAPFRYIRNLVFTVKQGPQRVKGEIMRAQGQVNAIKSDFKGYGSDVKELKGKAQSAQQYAQGRGKGAPGGTPQGQPGAQQAQFNPQMAAPNAPMAAAGGPGGVVAPQAKRPKMGLFSKKKKCPGCGQKLHASWGECPYCGWGKAAGGGAQMGGGGMGGGMPSGGQGQGQGQGQGMGGGGMGGGFSAPMPSGGAKQRTIALDLNAPPPSGPISDGLVGWFIPLEGRQSGELYQIKGRMTVGKAGDCDIVIAEDSISGHHAEFVPTANGFRLNDLGSTNGTFVNDKRVSTHDLVDNDNVKLGRLNFKYKAMV